MVRNLVSATCILAVLASAAESSPEPTSEKHSPASLVAQPVSGLRNWVKQLLDKKDDNTPAGTRHSPKQHSRHGDQDDDYYSYYSPYTRSYTQDTPPNVTLSIMVAGLDYAKVASKFSMLSGVFQAMQWQIAKDISKVAGAGQIHPCDIDLTLTAGGNGDVGAIAQFSVQVPVAVPQCLDDNIRKAIADLEGIGECMKGKAEFSVTAKEVPCGDAGAVEGDAGDGEGDGEAPTPAPPPATATPTSAPVAAATPRPTSGGSMCTANYLGSGVTPGGAGTPTGSAVVFACSDPVNAGFKYPISGQVMCTAGGTWQAHSQDPNVIVTNWGCGPEYACWELPTVPSTTAGRATMKPEYATGPFPPVLTGAKFCAAAGCCTSPDILKVTDAATTNIVESHVGVGTCSDRNSWLGTNSASFAVDSRDAGSGTAPDAPADTMKCDTRAGR